MKKKMISFYFFFVNRLYSFLPPSLLNARLCFHVIHPHLIIQHKVLISYFFCFFAFCMVEEDGRAFGCSQNYGLKPHKIQV